MTKCAAGVLAVFDIANKQWLNPSDISGHRGWRRDCERAGRAFEFLELRPKVPPRPGSEAGADMPKLDQGTTKPGGIASDARDSRILPGESEAL
ncbi:hypothetical protein AWH04_03910 [Rhodococcus erythropolis]|nr:hypothetical protein AWH04_03910 [Rhodococcus erythropolis]